MKSGRMKRILLSVIAFLFVGCSIAGGTVLLSNTYISDNTGGGIRPLPKMKQPKTPQQTPTFGPTDITRPPLTTRARRA